MSGWFNGAALQVSLLERTLGLVILERKTGDAIFTEQEKKRLTPLLPHIVRAFSHLPLQPAAWIDTDQEGLLVAQVCGKIINLTPQACHLLALATASDGHVTPNGDSILPAPVIRLCNDLARLPGEQHSATVTESWSQVNLHGRFIFHVYYLPSLQTLPCQPLIGVTLRRQESLLLKLWRKIDILPLSLREMQFCLLLAGGYPQATIVNHMHISEHTAITHRRHIYTKLAVHSRAELMSKLLAL